MSLVIDQQVSKIDLFYLRPLKMPIYFALLGQSKAVLIICLQKYLQSLFGVRVCVLSETGHEYLIRKSKSLFA